MFSKVVTLLLIVVVAASKCFAEETLVGSNNLVAGTGMHDNTRLYAQDKLHGPCNKTSECEVLDSECLYEMGADGKNVTRCICPPETFVEATLRPNSCLPIRTEPGSFCEEEQQCTLGFGKYAECSQRRVCQCTPPYEYLLKNCYQPATLGKNCSLNEECVVGVSDFAECDPTTGKCSCMETAFETNGTCQETKHIGDCCKTDSECSDTIKGEVYCNYLYMCACFEEFEPSKDRSMCSSAQKLVPISCLLLLMISLIFD